MVWRIAMYGMSDSARVIGGELHLIMVSLIIVTFMYVWSLKMHFALFRPRFMKFLPMTVIWV